MSCQHSNSNEINVVLLLSKPTLSEEELELLKSLLDTHMNWSSVIGMLQAHGLMGVSWLNIYKYIINGSEKLKYYKILNILECSYNVQLLKTKEQLVHTTKVCEELYKRNIKYAILKGLALTHYCYQDYGAREFNDNDILIHPDNLQEAIELLNTLGYIQGTYDRKKDEFTKATRRELITRPLVSHEVVPLLKKVSNNQFLKLHIIDLQFSIDLMTDNRTNSVVKEILDRRISVNLNSSNISTLDPEDTLSFLCIHFYKEAISNYDVMRYKDLSLYKLVDIYNFVLRQSVQWDNFLERIRKYNLSDAVYFTFYYLNTLYQDEYLIALLKTLIPSNPQILNEVFNYNSNRVILRWEDSIIDRVFDMNRPSKVK